MEILARIIDWCLSKISIILIFRLGGGIGDQVCMTAVVNRVFKAYPSIKIVVATNLPELYDGNPAVYHLVKVHNWQRIFWRILRKISLRGKSRNLQYFEDFGNYHQKEILPYAQNIRPGVHLTNLLSENFSYDGIKLDITPHLFISSIEKLALMEKTGLTEGAFSIIHSEGKTGFTEHKEWGPNKFQQVVKNVPTQMVQVGMIYNQKLKGTIDLRGKLTIRELCVLFSICKGVICQEGLYHHLAAAFNKPAITMYTFIDPKYSAYTSTIPVTAHSSLECAPCFDANICKAGELLCSHKISALSVLSLANKHGVV
jgi:ADP-heptose:LPS heptosyltransferase